MSVIVDTMHAIITIMPSTTAMIQSVTAMMHAVVATMQNTINWLTKPMYTLLIFRAIMQCGACVCLGYSGKDSSFNYIQLESLPN